MQTAVDNQLKIADIRRRMLSHDITYEQAKAEAQPVIDHINAAAKRLAKKYNLPARKVSFAAMMR
jgi:hypothetical protein